MSAWDCGYFAKDQMSFSLCCLSAGSRPFYGFIGSQPSEQQSFLLIACVCACVKIFSSRSEAPCVSVAALKLVLVPRSEHRPGLVYFDWSGLIGSPGVPRSFLPYLLQTRAERECENRRQNFESDLNSVAGIRRNFSLFLFCFFIITLVCIKHYAQ